MKNTLNKVAFLFTLLLIASGCHFSMGLDKADYGVIKDNVKSCKSDKDCAKLCPPKCTSKNCIGAKCFCSGCSHLFNHAKF
ncbi:hypothetical protein ABFS82_01G088800 [Erythranthe guttata]